MREGKATLPLIAAMQRGNNAESATIRNAIEAGDISKLDEVASIVKRTGALDVARQAALQEARRAMDAVRRLPEGSHRDCLIQLASQLLERDH